MSSYPAVLVEYLPHCSVQWGLLEDIQLNGITVQEKRTPVTFLITINDVFNIQCLLKDSGAGGIIVPNALDVTTTGFNVRLDAYGEGTSVPSGTADVYYLIIGR